MIRKLEVKGLNNRLDGAWEFNEDLNVITGRNGSGKTTLLKLIWYSISGNLGQIIFDIPFRSVSIKTDWFSLSIIQVREGEGRLECKFANKVEMGADFRIPWRGPDNEQVDAIGAQTLRGMGSLFFPSFRRIEGGFAKGPRYSIVDGAVSYKYDRFGRPIRDKDTEALREVVSRFSTAVQSYHTHRFIVSISTDDIVELLTRKFSDVSEKTSTLHAKSLEYITQKTSERKLSDDPIPILDGIQKQVEWVNEERDLLLKPFSVLGERIRDILHYEGIRITTGITLGEAKGAIGSDKLSAGEKQMLSFLCYNAFSENTAIFIDEPELSLHVDWQRLLLPTLLEQETGNQFFVATHSPFIYTQYPEKEILLDEDRGGN